MASAYGVVMAAVLAGVCPGPMARAQDRVDAVRVPAGDGVDAAASGTRPPLSGADRGRELQLRAEELRRHYAPEVLATVSLSHNGSESIDRYIAAGRMPLAEGVELAIVAEHNQFRYHPAAPGLAETTDITSLELRAMWTLDESLRPWLAVTPYVGKNAAGVGGAAGVVWAPVPGTELRGQGTIWEPWKENTLAVSRDGRAHTVSASLYHNLPARLAVYLDGAARWYELGPRAPANSAWAGASYEGGARLNLRLIEDETRSVGRGFLDPRAWGEDTMVMRLTPFASVRRKVYHMVESFNAVPVTPASTDIRTGLEWRQPLTDVIGLTADGSIGLDAERDLDFGDLWLVRAGAVAVPVDNVRLWGGYEIISETAAGTAGGRTETWTFGVNVNF